MHAPVLLPALPRVAVGAATLPDNLRPELGRAEDRLENDRQIVTCSRVTMQVQASRRSQHSVQLH